jgi:acyl carrier protein
MEQLADEIRAVVAAELMVDPADVTDDLGPGEIALWDSIGHLQIVHAVERRFDLVFTIIDVMTITSVSELVLTVRDYIDRKEKV